METLRDILKDARDTLDELLEDGDTRDIGDIISEIADGSTPVYNGVLLELAAGNNDLALTEPECGPAFDGSPTPVNIIAANVYEAICADLYEHHQERDEAEDDE